MHRAGITLFLLPRQRWILIPTANGVRPGLRLRQSGRKWVLVPTARLPDGLRPLARTLEADLQQVLMLPELGVNE